MKKSELRIKYKALRQSLSEEEIEEMSVAIANNLLGLPIWQTLIFMFFYPSPNKKK
jgi:5-formyltetrahydrofolate cyclo-ligase